MVCRMLLPVVTAVVLLAGSAGADGTIYGCANNRTGRVRMIVTSPPTCRATETPLSWQTVHLSSDPNSIVTLRSV